MLSGPMFEPSVSKLWASSFGKEGAHYNIFHVNKDMGMDGLRRIFPNGKADEMNFVLFSTSGIHGTYKTIEECEYLIEHDNINEDHEHETPEVTFVIVHPRLVCVRYGNAQPKTLDDIAFLKNLRQSSWEATQTIGKEENDPKGT